MDPADRVAPVVLFDGSCGLCARGVQFVLRRDRAARFRFAALQSQVAQDLLRRAGVTGPLPDSMALVDGDRVFWRSDAALRVARGLGWPWSWGALLLVVPRPLRDLVYRFVAAHRRRWAGDHCLRPAAALRERFLDAGERGDAATTPAAR